MRFFKENKPDTLIHAIPAETMREKNILISGFMKSLEKFSERPALKVEGQYYTYECLASTANNIANTIIENESVPNALAAILGYRSMIAYAGILGILASGKGYAPLNPKFPIERTYRMFLMSHSNILVVGKECIQTLKLLLPRLGKPVVVILPDTTDAGDLPERFARHRFITQNNLCRGCGVPEIPEIAPEKIAYLLFTSGTTGSPKGIAVSHRNVTSYVNYICKTHDINEHDRFSQTFDLTFDLSVHDMFVCWERGACLFCIPEKSLFAPAKFIKDNELTMWFSVPSLAMLMSRIGMLKPSSFPALKYSLFCGEPFSSKLALEWQEAAQNSIVENLYGPTETTIAITRYRLTEKNPPRTYEHGILPIGWIFDGHNSCIIDEKRKVVNRGEVGELCISGTQVTKGYLDDIAKTTEQYIEIPESGNGLWYRTGDLVKQDGDDCLHYLGRVDNQVKVLGHRVELGEIDSILRKASGSEMAVSLAWPIRNGSASGIVAFISSSKTIDKQCILDYCRRFLPEYMVPKEIYPVREMPLNLNGKIDRLRLVDSLEKGNDEQL